MPRIINLGSRLLKPEMMDQPELETARLFQALRTLARLNLLCMSSDVLWSPIRGFGQANRRNELRILDVGSGGGDVSVNLWRKALGAGIPIEIHGCDKNPHAVRYAAQRAERCGAEVDFFVRDVIEDGLPPGYDVIVSSLFLHHLSDEQASDMLRRMAEAAKSMLIVYDLRRSIVSLGLTYLACYTFTQSEVVRYDGPRSVAAAFTVGEIRNLAFSAGLDRVSVTRHWPFRYRLVWRRS